MDIVNEIKEILSLHNPDDKENGLEHLIDVFEYRHGLNKADAIEGTKLLLNAALQAQEGMRETFFRAINSAVVYEDIGDQIDWSSLVALLPSLQKVHLEYILNILGLSGQEKYLPLLETYAASSDPEVKEWGVEAIKEALYRIAHASD